VHTRWPLVALGLVVVAVAIVVLTRDEGAGPVETTEWADSVCASLGEWRGAITSLADVRGELTAEALEDRLDAADSATDELVDDLQSLGPPDLEAGDEAEQALDDAAEGLRESYDALREAAQGALDADTPTAFLQQLASLAPQFQALVRQAQDVMATLRSASLFGESSAELEQAFAAAPSCAQLQQTG
jgi:hypothetical protein